MEEQMELYRKYRPSTFDEMVGNESAINSAKKELENGSHCFLFVGGSGQGKTSLARIMAKELGASEISIHEINSANNRGVDTAREIMEQMSYGTIDGSPMVYILDEVHSTTNVFQNSLLKSLEDTPKNVYFFLCTTDPQKLIKPLVTRCSVVNLKPLNEEEMTLLLKRVGRAEGKRVTSEVVSEIFTLSEGGSRKALKLLSKVLYLDSEEEQLKVLSESNISEESAETIELCRVLMNKNVTWSEITKVLKNIDLSEPEKVRMAVMGYMNSVLMKGMNPNAVATLQAFGNNPTYNNGKFQITIALLDTLDLLNE